MDDLGYLHFRKAPNMKKKNCGTGIYWNQFAGMCCCCFSTCFSLYAAEFCQQHGASTITKERRETVCTDYIEQMRLLVVLRM